MVIRRAGFLGVIRGEIAFLEVSCRRKPRLKRRSNKISPANSLAGLILFDRPSFSSTVILLGAI
jgi:hypothetical protein